MEKILLIGINARYTHSNLAIRYLRNYKKFDNIDIRILEFSINLEIEKITDNILTEDSTVLLFSVYIWNSKIIKLLLLKLSEIKYSGKIILGGPEVSFNSKEWIYLYSNIDFIIKGPGEESFVYLVEKNFLVNNKIISRLNPHFNKIPFPYCDDDFLQLKNKYIYYESTRGCPFKCAYCLSSRDDQKVEYRELDLVKNELDYLIKKNPGIIKFVDRTFNLKKEHYREIWKFLIKHYLFSDVKYHFEIFPELLEEDDFDILKDVPKDMFQFEMGIQSLNEKSLNSINRNSNWERTRKNISKLKDMGNIHLHVDLIAGLPYENLISFKNSFNSVFSLMVHHFQLGFLKLLPGTELNQKKSEFLIKHFEIAPYEVSSTKWLSEGDIKLLKKIENSIDLFYNPGNFPVTVKHLIEMNSSYFDFFESLSRYKSSDENYYNKWEKDGKILIEYIEKDFMDKRSFFIDCLRWDWIHRSKISNYISFLKSDFTKVINKRGINFLIGFSQKGVIDFNGESFSQDELKRAFFFQAESVEFSEMYMKEPISICILPDKRKILIRKDLTKI